MDTVRDERGPEEEPVPDSEQTVIDDAHTGNSDDESSLEDTE